MKKFKMFFKSLAVHLLYSVGAFNRLHVATRNQIRRGNAVRMEKQYFGLKKH